MRLLLHQKVQPSFHFIRDIVKKKKETKKVVRTIGNPLPLLQMSFVPKKTIKK
jgi:hypothetical protein